MGTVATWRNYNDGAVALPARQFADDQPSPWPQPAGGQNGTVDIPQRDNADVPATPSPVSPAAGGLGMPPMPGNVAVWTGPDFAQYGRLNATPFGSLAIHYLRRFVSTGANAIAGMVNPDPATTAGTTNAVAAAGAPRSPIPVWRRFIVETFTDPWGQGRLYQDYYDPPEVTKPAGVRRQLAMHQLPRMGDPYVDKLTRLATAPGAGAPAQTVLVQGDAAAFPFNPFAGK